jgi:RNA 2',3'-cyclic 3'-phosphodiesterase
MRLFIAVEVPRVDAELPTAHPPERHLTLAFLGETPEERIPAIEDAMREASATGRPFDLVLGPGGAFPDGARPRVVWVGVVEGGGALAALHGALATALERRGFATERRAFVPHVTALRVRGPRDEALARSLLRALDGHRSASTRVTELVLFESRLHPTGAERLVRTRASLGGTL